jgi:hypothetical protein
MIRVSEAELEEPADLQEGDYKIPVQNLQLRRFIDKSLPWIPGRVSSSTRSIDPWSHLA